MNWEMTYTGPRVVLDTRYGPATATFTDGGHASVRAGGLDRPHVNDNHPAFTYRDQRYLGHADLYASFGWGPGVWDHHEGDTPSTLRAGLEDHAFRNTRFSNAPAAYSARMAAAMTDAVVAYVAENPAVLAEAQLNAAHCRLAAAQERASDAVDAAIKAQSAALAAQNAVTEAEAAVRAAEAARV